MITEMHAKAINVARRDSVRNENDLLQENLFEEDSDYGTSRSSPKVTEKYCASFLDQALPHNFNLPLGCNEFEHIKTKLEQKRAVTAKNSAIAFAGMSPREACEARTSREHRLPTEAQLIRRMTTRNSKTGVSSWF